MSQAFQKLFDLHASNHNGSTALSPQEFKNAILPQSSVYSLSDSTANLLFAAADSRKVGLLSAADFNAFESLLATPDAEFRILKNLIQKDDTLTADQIQAFFKAQDHAPRLNWASDAVRLAIGTGSNHVAYSQLAQFVKIIKQEKLKAHFISHDKSNSGYIHSCCALPLIASVSGHQSSSKIASNYKAASERISFCELSALSNVLSRLDVVADIASSISHNGQPITPTTFAETASKKLVYDSFSPLEISALFRLLGPKEAHSMTSFTSLLNPAYDSSAPLAPAANISATMELARGVYNFTLGSAAGALGAAAVYPIGTFETHLRSCQNENAEPAICCWSSHVQERNRLFQKSDSQRRFQGTLFWSPSPACWRYFI